MGQECEPLGSLESLHFAYRYGSPCFPEIILLLKAEPALGGGAKRLGQPERHCGAYSCASVEKLRKRLTRDAQRPRGSRNGEAERFKAQLAYYFARMRRIVHFHNRRFSMIIQIVNVKDVAVFKTKNHGHRPKSIALTLELVQPESRQIQISWMRCGIKNAQDQA